MIGKVKWFNNNLGYGFIEANGLSDIFFHYSTINMKGYRTIQEGDTVNFKLFETSKGLQAKDVNHVKITTIV